MEFLRQKMSVEDSHLLIKHHQRDLQKRHIESFPRMESHYVRKASKRQYLAADLSIGQMWEYYKKDCESKEMEPVEEKTYRDIFCKEYNLSFYKPKKDQCTICNVYELRKLQGETDENTTKEYTEHHERKRKAWEERNNDKDKAQ